MRQKARFARQHPRKKLPSRAGREPTVCRRSLRDLVTPHVNDPGRAYLGAAWK
jgi:hypothetical protein